MFTARRLRRKAFEAAAAGVVYEGYDRGDHSGSNGTPISLSSTIIGTDSLLVAFVACELGVTRTLSTCTYDGVSGTILGTVSVDGGNAQNMAVVVWDYADIGSSRTANVVATWNSPVNTTSITLVSLSGVDQTTPHDTWVTNTATGVANNGTLATTMVGSSGDYCLTHTAVSDSTAPTGSANFTEPGVSTERHDTSFIDAAYAFATVDSLASASETLTWTQTTGLNIDSFIVVSLAINAA